MPAASIHATHPETHLGRSMKGGSFDLVPIHLALPSPGTPVLARAEKSLARPVAV
jgi:hypothetical protein